MKRERLDEYTEKAIRATEAGKLIPPIVYLPRRLRGQKVRLTEGNMVLTQDPPTVAENHVRITGADPVGFLIAVMHGQPIPEFRVTRQGSIDLYYSVPEFDLRVRVAQYLASKVTITRTAGAGRMRDKAEAADYNALIANAEGRAALQAENEE